MRHCHDDVLVRLSLGMRDAELHQPRDQDGTDNGPKYQRRHQRAFVAQILAELLAKHRPDAAKIHLPPPSSPFIRPTKASSSWLLADMARISASAPAATTFPPLITTTSSQS